MTLLPACRRRLVVVLLCLALCALPSVQAFQQHVKVSARPTNTNSIRIPSSSSSVLQATLLPPKNGEEPPSDNVSLDWDKVRQQAGLFREMALPYYKESIKGRWLLAGLIALTLLNSGVSVAFSYLGKDFWNALSSKNADEFYQVLSKYIPALLVGAPVVTLYRFQREQLAVHWREWMTTRTFELYTQQRVYYNIESQYASTIDNPDQRLAQDVNSFTGISLQLVITLLTSLIDLASFSTILWSIYPQLFVAIIVYASIGTVATTFLGRSLVGLNIKQLQKEADLRYSLVRLRDNSESIAFYAGEDIEGRAVNNRLDNVMSNQRQINTRQRNLEFFINGYRYLIQVLPVAVVAPRYFAGEITLGVISQSAGAFNHILSDLSIIINQFERLSAFSAGIERLSTFYEAMREVDASRDSTTGDLLPIREKSSNATAVNTSTSNVNATAATTTTVATNGITTGDYGTIRLYELNTWQSTSPSDRSPLILLTDKLDLCTPDRKRLLIKDLTLQLPEGQNMLIVGNSGAGKSSLLRAIAGLWITGNGAIGTPPVEDIYFLPQRPYCTIGCLKDQLLYPSIDTRDDTDKADMGDNDDNKNADESIKRAPGHLLKHELSDQDLLDILDQVDLSELASRSGDGDPVKGLYTVLDWSNTLSLGEQQRLAFGRLLVNRPRLVILDEATSALDMVAEARMYNLLQNMARKNLNKSVMSAPGLTYISVGHRPSLEQFHTKKLRLLGQEKYEITTIETSSLQIPKEVKNM